MAQDYIHYVKRRVQISPRSSSAFYQELQSDLDGLQRPRFHTTKSLVGPASRVRAGDTIWLFGQLASPWGALPPSLDARIDVAEDPKLVTDPSAKDGGDANRRLRYEAAKTSRWFPLADATCVLQVLHSRNAHGKVVPLMPPGTPVGRRLQCMRQVDISTSLRAWEEQLDRKGFEFVSYRLRDGTPAAFEQVVAILRQGRAAFWDRWSLPRRLAERREWLNPPALTALIEERIGEATTVWGIETAGYGECHSYSRAERVFAEACGKLVLVPASAFLGFGPAAVPTTDGSLTARSRNSS